MSSPQIVYAHLKDVRDFRVGKILKKATTIEPTYTISKVVGILVNANSYDVFCMDGKDVLTIGARDLLSAKDVENMKVKPLLRKIQPLTRSDTVEKAAALLSHYRMRSVPIVENDQIIGVINVQDIIGLLQKRNLKWIPANRILVSGLITVKSDDSLATARKIMITKKIDHLPVIKGNEVSHVLTSMHLLQVIKPGEKIGMGLRGVKSMKKYESEIGNMGSSRIPNLDTHAPLSLVIDSMLKNDASCCLLTLWDNIHGIITYKDIVDLLESKIPSDVPLYMVGLPEDYSSAEIVKTKFDKIIRTLRKAYPDVESAKASIKTIHNPASNRPHYEVGVRIITPYKTYNYDEIGWDLSKIFDNLGSKIVRNLSQRGTKRLKASIRKIDMKDIF